MKTKFRSSSFVFLAALFSAAFCGAPGRAGVLGPLTGEEHGFWKGTSLILAQVVKYRSQAELGNNAQDNLITLRPLGTLCGEFDVSKNTKLVTEIGGWGYESMLPPPPYVGKYVLALLEPRLDRPSSYQISRESMLFMPNKGALSILNGLSDPRIEQALAGARKVRYATDLAVVEPKKPEDTSYWGTHFLLYGRIRAAEKMPKDEKTMRLMLYPMMTLSGNFDTGLSHRMILTGDAKLLEARREGKRPRSRGPR